MLECCVSAGNRRKMLGKCYLRLSAVTRYIQENTGNATSKHGYSTLGNWRTCKCMHTFSHYWKYFLHQNQDCEASCYRYV